MTEKQKRTYRLTDETISQLGELSERWKCTATDALSRAIFESHTGTVADGQEPDGDIAESLRREVEHYAREVERLNQQIDVKDGQISDLAANLRAAQALHAAERMPKAIKAGAEQGESSGTDNDTATGPVLERPTRWDYLKAVFTGCLSRNSVVDS